MGREARIMAAKKRREREAFLDTEAGRVAMEKERRRQIELHARKVAEEILQDARQRAFARTVGVEVNRWMEFHLEVLIDRADMVRDRGMYLAARDARLRVVSAEIEDVKEIAKAQLAFLADPEQKYSEDNREMLRHAMKMALSNVFAQVSAADLEGLLWFREEAPAVAEQVPLEPPVPA